MKRILSTCVLLAFASPAFAVGDGSCAADGSLGSLGQLIDVLAEIRTLMDDHTSRADEARILEIFRTASAAELDSLIGAMPQHEFHEMVGDIDDRWIGPDNRTAFLDLLARTRLGDLSIESRARLIAALQESRTDSKDERAIRDIFLGTHGADLSALKKAIDHGGDHRDLQQLLYHDIDDSKIFDAILGHFTREARTSPATVKVFSDIDDTFYVNLKDDRYPGKTVYPGVVAFYDALDHGTTNDALGDLMFLSARPYDRPGAAEHHTRSTLEGAGVPDPTILSGDLAHVIGNHAIADKKYSNWRQMNTLYPESTSVFVGDSGQGDAIFGARAVATGAGKMSQVFIHNVTNLNDAQRADFASKGVQIFDTYVGAATDAYKAGRISKEGLLNVAESAQRELAAIPFTNAAQKAAREAELIRDLDAMRAAIQ